MATRALVQVDAFPEVVSAISTPEDERYTQLGTIVMCTKLACVKVWDLDVAACEAAHVAKKFYTLHDSGLISPWWGRVWCNPPFSCLETWVTRAWSEWRRTGVVKTIGMLLPMNRQEQPWWQRMVEPYRDRVGSPLRSHNLPGRVRFGKPGDLFAEEAGSPPGGCVFLVWQR
jgi:hypothetical protein